MNRRDQYQTQQINQLQEKGEYWLVCVRCCVVATWNVSFVAVGGVRSCGDSGLSIMACDGVGCVCCNDYDGKWDERLWRFVVVGSGSMVMVVVWRAVAVGCLR
ncbi:hypothetical protein ACFE04_003271 [Oxalis oulophora]